MDTTHVLSKRGQLEKIRDECFENVKLYKKKYKKTKIKDDVIESFNALLNATSITLIVIGFAMPPLLIASASLSGSHFIISSIQNKYNLKQRYLQHSQTMQHYDNLGREVNAVLTKNNLSSEQYQTYIEEINNQLSLIHSNQIF